jgi:D-3-phosphoglycerate dehydrogenase
MIIARAALRNARIFQHQPAAFAVRGMADVQVEHGRGNWQTYGDLESYKQGKYQIKTFNKISPVGLSRFPNGEYDVRTGDSEAANAHAILLRSHKLQEEEVPNTVRAIAR